MSKEEQRVEDLNKQIELEAEKLKTKLFQLIKESEEKSFQLLDEYQEILKKELETLNPNQTASNLDEIIEKGEKAEATLLKERKKLQAKSFEAFSFVVQKSLDENILQRKEKSRIHHKIQSDFNPILIFFGLEPSNDFVEDFAKLTKISGNVDFFELLVKFVFNKKKVELIFF
jgi:hypothetical protein